MKPDDLTPLFFTPVLTMFLLIVGCSEPEMRDLVDNEHAELCILSDGDPTLSADQELDLVVMWSCASQNEELVDASCHVSVEGDVIRVSSHFVYEVHQAGLVDLSCNPGMVTCDVGAIEEGDYEVWHGDRRAEFTLPSQTNLDCGRIQSWDAPESAQL